MRYLIFGASRYSIDNEGRAATTGAKLYAIDLDDPENKENRKGSEPITLDADLVVFDLIGQVPAYYDLSFKTKKVTKKQGGNTVGLQITSAKFVEALFPDVEAGKKAA